MWRRVRADLDRAWPPVDTGVRTTSVSASDLGDEVLGNYQGGTIRIGNREVSTFVSPVSVDLAALETAG
ncbi:hypothetical protein GCM10011341_03400 [Frigidibacter albus]|nr:hypothetical protein GCM10011341_03400 [Frigidibacter albus]